MMKYRFGPSGGHGGHAFEDALPGDTVALETGETASLTGLIGVRVRHADRIDAVSLVWGYSGPDGQAVPAPTELEEPHGGPEGVEELFELHAPDEWITVISGRYGQTVDSLRLETNLGRSAEFGGKGGDHAFQYDIPAGLKLAGFFGSAGYLLDALGVILSPAVSAPETVPESSKTPARKTPARKAAASKPAAPSEDAKAAKPRKAAKSTADTATPPAEDAPKPKRNRKKAAES
ncbi:jacalin-like lectin [Deinococcus ruber]|uniref:Jacalin-type lectin domain-containing protein n=1 Tax=Deinococcus ruber TaxID=1848197 RepID=A0A918CAP0_9DEIO|nr:jacalin-like lectin [Deinococcus ruber]GGR14133.1 hypothetical protein GCM10008957_28710 [Deinococcus ruber]